MRVPLVLATLILLAACNAQIDKAALFKGHSMPLSPAPLAGIHSASVELPADEETFGDGPQADVLNGNCLACHSAAMVRYQPPLNRKQWSATVNKMREAYGAAIDPSQTAAIVDALMTVQPEKP